MLRFFILLLVALSLKPNDAFLQEPPMEFGKIPPADLKMKVFEADTTAPAVVLCDYGKAVVEEGYDRHQLWWQHHKRIKILNKEGFQYANVAIPFYSFEGRETFDFEQAEIHLPNGLRHKLEKKDVHVERVNEYYSLAKFTFPQVAEGCVIEYVYSITDKSVYELKDWYFQAEIPVLWSEYRASFPEFVSYVYLFQGNEGMTASKDEEGNTLYEGKNGSFLFSPRRFVMRNAPAMKEEGYVTTMDDYLARIRFQINEIMHPGGYLEKVLKDWKSLQKELKEYSECGEQMLKKVNYKKITEKVLPLAAHLTGHKEKAWFFYDYLTKNIHWDERHSMYARHKLNEVFEQGKATSGELNMMLYVLLTEAGIKANPVLLSTRSHGKMYEEYPILDQFNYLMVQAEIDGKLLFMDATDPMRPPGYPSVQALNGRGLKLDFETGYPVWIDIAMPKDGIDVMTFDLHLDEAGTLSGTMVSAHKGYNAIPERRSFLKNSTGNHWQQRLAERYPEAVVLGAKMGNLLEREKMFYDTLLISIPNAAQVSGDYLYLSPVIYSEFDENIFKLKDRLYPVDVPFPFMEQTSLKLTLPAGYVFESLPEVANFSLPAGGGNFFFATSTNGEQAVQCSAKVSISKQRFTPAEYPALKEMFDLMVKKQKEDIVIKKKG